MIPFRDANPSGTTAYVTIALLAANVAVFFYEAQIPRQQFEPFIQRYGVRPRYVVEYLKGNPRLSGHFVPIFLPFVTSLFLHGGLLHLLGNMLYLWIFGDNVEDRMGHGRFLAFYLICGLGASAAHVVANPSSTLPTVGASGAIAGVLGAYLLAYPYARVATLLPIGFFLTVVDLPAFVVLGLWFLLQYFSGMQSLRMPESGGVAWWAHIGGFALGMLLLPVFQKPASQRRRYVYSRSR